MSEWDYVPDRRLRRRLQASSMTLAERVNWPLYLYLKDVLSLYEAGVTPDEYRRRVRAISRITRRNGGDRHDVAWNRYLIIDAAEAAVPFEQALALLDECGYAIARIAIRAHVPDWFAEYAYHWLDLDEHPEEIERLYRRLITYQHSGPDLVRVLLEETHAHDAVRDWARLRLPAETVRLLLRARISLDEVRSRPEIAADPNRLRVLIALRQPSDGLFHLLVS